MYDLILLYSGGRDSTLLLEMALNNEKKVLCMMFNYGQKHIIELAKAEAYCINKKVNYQIVHLDKEAMPSSKLTDDGDTNYQGVSEWHVPGRNLMFISHATSIAEFMKIPLIWYGANYEDRIHLFPDCYQEWVYQMNKLLAINGCFPIKLEAPLLGMSKNTIIELCKQYNINEDKIFSGYGEQE